MRKTPLQARLEAEEREETSLGHFPPHLGVSSLRLSAKGYEKLIRALREELETAQQGEGERAELCAVAILA